MNSKTNFYQSISFLAIITASILLIPFIAMQVTVEVNWTLSDFVFAGIVIFGSGLIFKFVTRKSQGMAYNVAVGFGILTGFMLIWVNMAVGIVGSEDNPANLMYFAVIVIGLIGALVSRFEAEKMTMVMFAMALTQGLIATIILTLGLYQTPPSTIMHILGVNGFFVVLFTVSGLLFRYAAQEDERIENSTETINSDS